MRQANVYYKDIKMEEASASTFEYLGEGYARDAWNTYHGASKINR